MIVFMVAHVVISAKTRNARFTKRTVVAGNHAMKVWNQQQKEMAG